MSMPEQIQSTGRAEQNENRQGAEVLQSIQVSSEITKTGRMRRGYRMVVFVLGYLLIHGLGMGWGWADDPNVALKHVSSLILDGKKVQVIWPDGDTFRLILPLGRGPAARLKGYNTLENYGPVHRWGKWTAEELHNVGNRATAVARSKAWPCFLQEGGGGYGRLLASCPTLAAALISQGLAHVFSMTDQGDPQLLKLQQKAIRQKRGIWAKGVPEYIVTSVHGASLYRRHAYHRLISVKTGGSLMYRHADSFNNCEWICMKGSCMRYVDYRYRYGANKASCLRTSTPTRTSTTPTRTP